VFSHIIIMGEFMFVMVNHVLVQNFNKLYLTTISIEGIFDIVVR